MRQSCALAASQREIPLNILGISGLHNSVPFKKRELPHLSAREYRIVQGFDSAAALLTSEGIQAVAAEERFTREKATGAFPCNAIRYCLDAADLTPSAIDYVAHGFCYAPYKSLFEHDDFWRKQYAEVYSPDTQLRCLAEHFPSCGWSSKFLPVPHHMAHAASTFYLSGFQESLILVADGMGEVASTTLAIGCGGKIETIAQVRGLHSLGLLYGVFTLYLGFCMALDEYKVMGLAPYGNPRRFFGKVMDLIRLEPDGGYAIPVLYKNKTLEEQETYGGTLRVIAGLLGPAREPEAALTQQHVDIAAALQAALETCLLHVLRHFKQTTAQTNLCMAGGVALNCTANGLIKRSGLFDRLFIQPAAGDEGTSLGAALHVQNSYEPELHRPRMTLPLWGPDFDDETVAQCLAGRRDCEATLFPDLDRLIQNVVERLSRGEIVAWFQGRMEFGPRALGARSILADPRDPQMRARINRLVKKREEFRPFAPAVTSEAAAQIFEIAAGDEALYAHMLFVTQVRPAYHECLPAITHVDGSARVQTVCKNDHPRFWALLNEFGNANGIPVLLNTSFNVCGQPIVCTPAEAIDTFLTAGLDALVIENHVVTRQSADAIAFAGGQS
jgi:carbamoyltransferase